MGNDENEINEEINYLVFNDGIPGFPKDKKFIIMPVDEKGPFYYLQSLDTELCLLIADPFVFFPDYQIDLPDEHVLSLTDDDQGQFAVYVILTLEEDFKKTTANLLAPIIVNEVTRRGIQYIPPSSAYETRHAIFERVQSASPSATSPPAGREK
ncbi:MAG: flagellar assembly protein FliW [Syntrophomonadaceae bacterium]|nr:flagellar assembly protein FliW [Syntrophomonadaceae bacterium]